MSLTTWRKLIAEEMSGEGHYPPRPADTSKIVACTLDDAGLDREFDDGFGGTEGAAFTLWTEARVYFPVCYDGAESVGSAPRNPCDEACDHVGGG
jgi:hypothetical protein